LGRDIHSHLFICATALAHHLKAGTDGLAQSIKYYRSFTFHFLVNVRFVHYAPLHAFNSAVSITCFQSEFYFSTADIKYKYSPPSWISRLNRITTTDFIQCRAPPSIIHFHTHSLGICWKCESWVLNTAKLGEIASRILQGVLQAARKNERRKVEAKAGKTAMCSYWNAVCGAISLVSWADRVRKFAGAAGAVYVNKPKYVDQTQSFLSSQSEWGGMYCMYYMFPREE